MEKLTILIIDDENSTLEILNDLLKENYIVKIARDGNQGYNAYKRFSPKIVITDISMPNMDGISMVAKIRNEDHNTKIIFITSHDEIEYLLKSTSLKLTQYIVKPICKEELFSALEKAKKELFEFKVVNTHSLALDHEYIWNSKELCLTKDGTEVKLSPAERKILHYLLLEPNTLKTYDAILYELSDDGLENITKDSLKTLVTTLRKKIPSNLLKNVYGIGYKISL